MYSAEEFDKAKMRVLKYIMFKKRSKYEVKNKFLGTYDENMLEDIIEYLEEAGYINDSEYIERIVHEYTSLKNLSIKELKYKILAKGIDKNLIEDYFYENRDDLEDYEIKSATNIVYKKKDQMESEEIRQYLFKRGYINENINKALEEY